MTKDSAHFGPSPLSCLPGRIEPLLVSSDFRTEIERRTGRRTFYAGAERASSSSKSTANVNHQSRLSQVNLSFIKFIRLAIFQQHHGPLADTQVWMFVSFHRPHQWLILQFEHGLILPLFYIIHMLCVYKQLFLPVLLSKSHL